LRNSKARYGYGYHVIFLVVSKNGFRQGCRILLKTGRQHRAEAWEIEQDINSGNFDPTLAKYKPRTHLTLVKPVEKPPQNLTLDELWELYTDYKSR
jgi:hypothetical protein